MSRLLWSLLASAVFAQTYDFSDGGAKLRVAFAPNELHVTAKRGANTSATFGMAKASLGARLERMSETGSGGMLIVLNEPANRGSLAGPEFANIAPVFYATADDPGGLHRESARRLMTNRLLVRFPDTADTAKWRALQAGTGAKGRKESVLGNGWMIVEFRTPFDALDAALRMLGEGYELSPVFARQFQKKQASGQLQRSINDPLFSKQWHLKDDGAGIRMRSAWDIATGKGVNVTVVDDGLDIDHEDLSGNAFSLASGNHHNFNAGDPGDPSPEGPEQTHGTNCAGLLGAEGFNNRGVIGVAPEVRLMGLRLIAGPAGDDAIAEAMLWQPNGGVTHVSSNSWGPADDAKDLGRIGAQHRAALARATSSFRAGLGTVFCVSAGNGRGNGDDSSYDGFSSSRFVIGVGAVNRDGEPSSFSEEGINVAISALGGEFDPPGVLWTTNNTGLEALAVLKGKFATSEAPEDYSDAFNGTSAAAPQVSGAAALLLQHNPRLSYRDVKEILMRTATRTGLKGGDPFQQNGGGLFFSHSFGAGLLNVAAALDASVAWNPLGPLTSVDANSGSGIAEIPDGSADGAIFEFDFSAARRLRVESVEVEVNVAHAKRGDVAFVLTSPSGMRSVVDPRAADEGADFEDFLFTSVRHWGESSAGTWTLRIIDTKGNGISGAAGAITMRLFGTAQ